MPAHRDGRRFTLDEARALLPAIRRLTDDAVRESEPITGRLDALAPDQPEYDRLAETLSAIVENWGREVIALGGEPKGLWLVDFDNGDGYYCWRHPEVSIAHFHGYDDGFAGRVKII
jgi:hypothetical protein